MSYQDLSEGISKEEAARKISSVMPKKRKITNLNSESPPSVFVGSSNYPNVTIGVLSPPRTSDPSLFDSPKQWASRKFSIEKIASLRGSMVNSFKRNNVRNIRNGLDDMREIALAKKPPSVEASLEKHTGQVSAGRVKPTSNFSQAGSFHLTENPSVDKQLEDKFYDRDAQAETAIKELAQKGKDVYRIRQALTAGLLGEREERKLVPTRWGITATDDMASKHLRDNLEEFKQIDGIRHFENEFLGNEFDIFLIPGSFEYELVELKRPQSTWNKKSATVVKQNYESNQGRSEYASETAGAFYATRLAILEYMNEKQVRAKALVIRNVKPEYYAPLGVWVVREGVRNTLGESSQVQNYDKVREILSSKYTINYPKIVQNSRLVSSKQTTIDSF